MKINSINLYNMAIAGYSGSLAGKRAADLFHEVEIKAIKLSAFYPYSKEEIINRCLKIARTTTNTFDQAFEIVENEIKNES